MKNVEDNRASVKVKPYPRTEQDKDSPAQSDRLWEKNPQNTTGSGLAGSAKPDPDKWQKTNTH